MGKNYVGDIGTRIRMTTNEDLTNQTTTEFHVTKPDNTTAVWSITIETILTGIIYHDTVSGDFDQAGKYLIQAYALFNDGDTFLSETVSFKIYAAYK